MKKLMLTLALLVVASSNASPEMVNACLNTAKINVTEAQRNEFLGCIKGNLQAHLDVKKEGIMDMLKGFVGSAAADRLQNKASNPTDAAGTNASWQDLKDKLSEAWAQIMPGATE